MRPVQDKQGRSGPLTFCVVHHQILQRGRVVIDEEQDLVYRAALSLLPPPRGRQQAPPGQEL